MSQILVEIGGHREELGALWVHFQEPTRSPASKYSIMVPSAHVKQVFDPLGTTGPEKPLLEYINELVSEFGAFIVEGYMANIAKLMRSETKRYRWVIASVDSIREVSGGIELAGKALPFDPSLY